MQMIEGKMKNSTLQFPKVYQQAAGLLSALATVGGFR
jgi:hypothetical protein